MQSRSAIQAFVLCFVLHSVVSAQSVLYSSTISNDANTHFEVIGKAGNFYWLYKTKKNNSYKNGTMAWPSKEDRSFEVYDDHLALVKEIKSPLPDSIIKQYFIPQRSWFDQLVFAKSLNKTTVLVNRFAPSGDGAVKHAQLFDYPAAMELEDILVTRSPDRSKILLLGFVRGTSLTPDMYARVYTRDWELLHEIIYKEGKLVQPFIQYDRTEYLFESSDASPIKIINSGDWLMVAPARGRNNLVLCHFKNEDSSFVQMDVQQSRSDVFEFCSLSVQEGREAYLGILENITPTDRKLRMMQYSLAEDSLGYDTTYSFNLPNSFKNQEYQYEEEFIQIPGKGFMYMKEYGRPYYIDGWGEKIMLDNEQGYAAYSNDPGKLKFNNNEYTRYSDLSATKRKFERGDLSVKYFPFNASDTSWGGLIHVEQATQLRYADLSYACVAAGDKIIFLYNSLAKNEHKVSSSLILDHKGKFIEDGVIFWRPANVLNFQKAKLIHPGELFVPFDRNISQGFSIIRF